MVIVSNRSIFLLIILVLLPSCMKTATEKQNPFTQDYESHSNLPQILVNTGNKSIGLQYIDAVFSVDGKLLRGSIRGRGNRTWEYEKKPYKINLDREESLLGFGKSREWVLLAEYRDPSFMRTALMFGLAHLAGMPYSLNCKHVELYVDDEYQGVYVLAESVQRSPSRINIADDGFIIEDDQYWESEPLSFESPLGVHFTFKYPKPGNLDEGRLKTISAYIGRMESALSSGNVEDYLDLDSFAQWYIVMELLGVYDPNIYYVLKSKGGKLMMGPVWDAESALGLFGRDTDNPIPAPGTMATGYPISNDRYYFTCLLSNSLFIDSLKRNWDALKPLLPRFKEQMRDLFQGLDEAIDCNFRRWPGNYPPQCWQAEFAFIYDFFERRAAWFDGYVSYLTASKSLIPLDADISNPEYPVPEAVDLGLSVLWASCNLGAALESETGYYFAWGEVHPKNRYAWSNYAYGNDSGTGFSKYCYTGGGQWWTGAGDVPDGLDQLQEADDPVRVNLGGKWRMPTRWELWELWDYLSYGGGQIHYELRNNMFGFRITNPDTGGSVFFPCAGRAEDGCIEYFGTAGYYWTSSLARSVDCGPAGAYFIGVDGIRESVNEWQCGRFYGMPVRPVCDR